MCSFYSAITIDRCEIQSGAEEKKLRFYVLPLEITTSKIIEKFDCVRRDCSAASLSLTAAVSRFAKFRFLLAAFESSSGRRFDSTKKRFASRRSAWRDSPLERWCPKFSWYIAYNVPQRAGRGGLRRRQPRARNAPHRLRARALCAHNNRCIIRFQSGLGGHLYWFIEQPPYSTIPNTYSRTHERARTRCVLGLHVVCTWSRIRTGTHIIRTPDENVKCCRSRCRDVIYLWSRKHARAFTTRVSLQFSPLSERVTRILRWGRKRNIFQWK